MTATRAVGRDRLVQLGLDCVPKILTLQDRVPHSPTYGCFDRAFWHLRTKDFPSGMAQEFVLPLALAYAHDYEDNTFFRHATIKEWVRAGIAYAARSAHRDGSCDDYYPYEKAAGAAAFSQYAILQALSLTGLDPAPFADFLTRRARWLARHQESGRLSNHEALIANGLLKLHALVGDPEFRVAAEKRVARLLSWQSPEGWFYEYQGCDPGYLTLTLGNMAEIDDQAPDLNLRPSMQRAISFLEALQPPDGWMGGEWTSRNTNNFFPHGLELCGAWAPEALRINDRAIAALDPAPEYRDDAIIAHHCWSYLKAARVWRVDRPAPNDAQTAARQHFPHAGIEIRRKGRNTLLVATKKGGSYRFYRADRLLRADTGVSVQLRRRAKLRTYVCHLWNDDPETLEADDTFIIKGAMGRAKQSQMTPMKQVVLRLAMLSFGRFCPNLIRRGLQALLITGDTGSSLRFERRLTMGDDALMVTDDVYGPGDIAAAGIGPAQTSIYTVMSRVYHPPQLQPWDDLTASIQPGDGLRLKHVTRVDAAP